MAQTTGAIPQSNFQVQISDDGADWVDISGQATQVARSDGDQVIGEVFTADGNDPIVTGNNKKAAETITVTAVYTEETAEAWETANALYRSGDKRIYLRWAPKGGIGTVVGNNLFTCANSAGTAIEVPIINCSLPDLDASSGEAAMFELSVRTPAVAVGATTTS